MIQLHSRLKLAQDAKIDPKHTFLCHGYHHKTPIQKIRRKPKCLETLLKGMYGYQCICATCLCQKFPDSLSPLSPALRPGLVPMVLEELLSARAKAKKELKQAAASGGHAL